MNHAAPHAVLKKPAPRVDGNKAGEEESYRRKLRRVKQSSAGDTASCISSFCFGRNDLGFTVLQAESWRDFPTNGLTRKKGKSIMTMIAEQEEVWAASLEDKPGALANKLSALAEAGADLAFTIARRAPDKPGTGVVFVTPLRGDQEIEAAGELGFAATNRLHSVRVEGRNERGIAGKLTQQVAKAGINLRGFSAAAIGTQFVSHMAFDTAEDAQKAIALLRQ